MWKPYCFDSGRAVKCYYPSCKAKHQTLVSPSAQSLILSMAAKKNECHGPGSGAGGSTAHGLSARICWLSTVSYTPRWCSRELLPKCWGSYDLRVGFVSLNGFQLASTIHRHSSGAPGLPGGAEMLFPRKGSKRSLWSNSSPLLSFLSFSRAKLWPVSGRPANIPSCAYSRRQNWLDALKSFWSCSGYRTAIAGQGMG